MWLLVLLLVLLCVYSSSIISSNSVDTINSPTHGGRIHAVYFEQLHSTRLLLHNHFNSFNLCVTLPDNSEVQCQNTNHHLAIIFSWAGNLCNLDEVIVSHLDIPGIAQLSRHSLHCSIIGKKDLTRYIESFITVDSPMYGEIVTGKLSIDVGSVSSRTFDSIYFEAVGIAQLQLSPTTETIVSHNESVQPSSMFFSVQTQDGKSGRTGYPTEGYLEFVLSDQDIRKHRRFRPPQQNSEYNIERSEFSGKPDRPIEVCIFAGPHMDGQKQIWTQQSLYMHPDLFHFTWLIHLQPPDSHSEDSNSNHHHNNKQQLPRKSNPVLQHLSDLPHIAIESNPVFPLEVSMLDQDPFDGRGPASRIWRGNLDDLHMYAFESLRAADFNIDVIRPQWCRELYVQMRDTLVRSKCDLVVYGNQGGFGSDVSIVHTAKTLGIPTVGELMNLNLHKLMVPAAVVAPSAYALEHESVASVLRSHNAAKQQDQNHRDSGRGNGNGDSDSSDSDGGDVGSGFGVREAAGEEVGRSALGWVISPSVDVSRFNPARFRYSPTNHQYTEQAYIHPDCRTYHSAPCVVVGFVARLAPEKNPGLFLQAAQALLRLHPFARFTIVGDGPLRSPLEALAVRLRISWAVDFIGWVSAQDLPSVLAGLDIVVNPSLRAWSETFCIANIEALAMELPLVTFAVGGIGEYIEDPSINMNNISTTTDSDPQQMQLFSVGGNGVVVHTATPGAIAHAVDHLILHPQLRRKLGEAGRRTVLADFTTSRQMQQYIDLYLHLFHQKNRK